MRQISGEDTDSNLPHRRGQALSLELATATHLGLSQQSECIFSGSDVLCANTRGRGRGRDLKITYFVNVFGMQPPTKTWLFCRPRARGKTQRDPGEIRSVTCRIPSSALQGEASNAPNSGREGLDTGTQPAAPRFPPPGAPGRYRPAKAPPAVPPVAATAGR